MNDDVMVSFSYLTEASGSKRISGLTYAALTHEDRQVIFPCCFIHGGKAG